MKQHNRITAILMLLLSAMCFITAKSIAQPFIGMNLTQKGIGANMGFLFNNIEVTANYKSLRSRNDVPKVSSLSAGYRYLLTQKEIYNWSVTPSIGIGNYRLKDFTAYNADPTGKTGVTQISECYPIVGVNLSRDNWIGQGFVSADYCNKIFFYGIGIRTYFYRRLNK